MSDKTLFLNRFQIIKELGQGSYGLAVLAKDMDLDRKVALKIIQKDSIKKVSHINRLRREINIHKLIDHPHVIKLYEVMESSSKIILVLEYAGGGDLFQLVVDNERLPENLARKLFRQIISAVIFCHRNQIAHRDLKPENILLDLDGNIKIIDFGFVRGFSADKTSLLTTYCGSLHYCPPEMLLGIPYHPGPADIWSLGVILFVCVNGYLPFNPEFLGKLCQELQEVQIEPSDFSSPECTQLMLSIIKAKPEDRATIEEIARHPWINDGYTDTPLDMPTGNLDLMEMKPALMKFIDLLESENPKDKKINMKMIMIPTSRLGDDATGPISSSVHNELLSGNSLIYDTLGPMPQFVRDETDKYCSDPIRVSATSIKQEFESGPVGIRREPLKRNRAWSLFKKKHVPSENEQSTEVDRSAFFFWRKKK